ncbi:hypothetical protein CHLNCDRAFT_145264 [Chlorella variabilis]|uniref:Fe/B12 periplasmic-binding domain-containing protein n=1 Tax=Chlorella variabilis TaxID=554065 RepID=E1ZE20_CHLVA|nr:hypothetical protein CHLNCDRAFT_145264 [Chlorella variabilis]EFN55954.1 hypothetical protein CHLNCDRAFT_145264 [Chlorella variabilis]|eukprot:XP_005848056.1 hypothetical protein CHLNCDRAFT_145264 [Chlorella variabilis]
MRVVSLLPSATDTVISLELASLLCDWHEVQHLPALTSSRVGDSIPVDEIDAVMSASAAAVREMALLGAHLAVPLLEFGLSVYHLHIEQLQQLQPDVILTCLQAAHGAVLSDGLLEAALHAVLGYAPRVVHCAAEDLAGVWRDMQAVADGLGVPDKGRQLVQRQQRQMADAAASARGRGSLRVACIQWPHPLMACGAWVPEMIQMTGSQDVCGAVDHAEVVSAQQLRSAAPDVVVFALCGLPLDKSAQAAKAAIRRLASVWAELPAAQHGRVAVVDGERVFSRPGPWLVQSMEALVELLHPEAQAFGHQGKIWRWLDGSIDAPAPAPA